MPRKIFECDPLTPYHLVARTNNKDWFEIPKDYLWDLMSDYLHFLHYAFNVQIHHFVLMANHYHMVASFPDANLSAALLYFNRETSRCIGKRMNTINHKYGNRVFRSRLGSFHYFQNTYKYLLRNPVEAGEVKRVEEYQYSTLHGLLGESKLLIPIAEDTLLFPSNNLTLGWLNTRPTRENYEAMRLALRRKDFALPKCSRSKTLHRLEQDLY
jgi:putative transposase